MKGYYKFIISAFPFTLGMILTLISLSCLVDWGLDFDEGIFWGFIAFFIIGFPTMLFGIKKLSSDQ